MVTAALQVDLIVIGAGINGAGIARDAALRGLRVLLVDKGDIGGGTTAYSTRLIHGGLRYLEHGEVGLVRESLVERERLLRSAPHLVRPLPLLIPIYRGDRRGPLLIRAGMTAYDVLSPGKSLPRHQMLGRDEALDLAPGLAPEGLLGAARYFDAQVTFAERLAVENAIDARTHGACVLTYHEVDRIHAEGDRALVVEGRDGLTGEPFTAKAPVVVNVAGPWVDQVLHDVIPHVDRRLIGGTKGSHIVVEAFPGAPADGLYAEARSDQRPFFILPWNDLYLIGTTDTRFSGQLETLAADEEEIDWLLAEANRVIPAAHLTRDDVRYSYAGVRPLPYAPTTAEGSVTRRHAIVEHAAMGGPRGLLSVVGGKLTTYRELSELVVDRVQRLLGRPVSPSRTANLYLPGGGSSETWVAFRQQLPRQHGISRRTADHLLDVYGFRAAELLASAPTDSLRQVIDAASGAIAAEIPWAFEREGARTLADVLARRTMVGLGANAGIGTDVAAANVARDTLGWDAARAEAEVRGYREWLRRYRPRALTGASSDGAS